MAAGQTRRILILADSTISKDSIQTGANIELTKESFEPTHSIRANDALAQPDRKGLDIHLPFCHR
ncbi:MAG: hypothetical protein BMS9Abin37_2021 [Acidobacteriota bacterium]|nr:MAG: hypothetical protein BMS9Abin37_2021 [Acidobacteriota bacterium]